jgi:hypothetical protein
MFAGMSDGGTVPLFEDVCVTLQESAWGLLKSQVFRKKFHALSVLD